MSSTTNIRPSSLAGQWYPADPKVLAERVDGYLNQAKVSHVLGKIIALVSPHAGHRFSGPVAGYAYRAIQGSEPEWVVILSPLHHPHTAPILTTKHDGYHTPLGDVQVDRDAVNHIRHSFQKETDVAITPIERDKEHAIEIQLPFMQRALTSPFTLLPLMIRDQDQNLMQALGDVIADFLSHRDGILLASTDLSHFYPAEQAHALDQTIINHIIDLNPEGIYKAERRKEGFACGKGALAAGMWAAKHMGANHAQHLKYGHSGDVTGDTSRVVGYTAAVLTQR